MSTASPLELTGLPSWRSYLWVVLTIPLAGALTVIPHQFLWGSGLANGWIDRELFLPSFAMSRSARILLMLLSLGLHEGLHAVGYALFGRVPWSQIDFSVRWTHLVVYAQCNAPLSREALQKALLLPAVILGALPAAVGLTFGLGWLTFYGFLLLVLATGDFVTLWKIGRRAP